MQQYRQNERKTFFSILFKITFDVACFGEKKSPRSSVPTRKKFGFRLTLSLSLDCTFFRLFSCRRADKYLDFQLRFFAGNKKAKSGFKLCKGRISIIHEDSLEYFVCKQNVR